jgi:dihydrodipicolinate synthase/N-acetylneuraminate lyase
MSNTEWTDETYAGVFAVPPLARAANSERSLDFEQNNQIVRHIVDGGVTRFIYGGNAFLYHVTLSDYAALLDWMSEWSKDCVMLPSAGPSFGRLIDQAMLLKTHKFPGVMALPCGDPRDAPGLEQGLREFADAAETRLILYLKEEANFGAVKEAGLDVVGNLVRDGICVAIKYAVVRENPAEDAYLKSLLTRVDRGIVISGIGERPAIIHMRDWKLPGFTTGSGCVAPRLSQAIHSACAAGEFEKADELREAFLALEDLRDAWSPAKVLHYATASAGIAETGPIAPFPSELSKERREEIAPVANDLARANAAG